MPRDSFLTEEDPVLATKSNKDKLLLLLSFTMVFIAFQLNSFTIIKPDAVENGYPNWNGGGIYFSENLTPPQLLDARVSPLLGTNETSFTFSVEYVDIDGDMPVSINVSIDGIAYAMIEADPGDLDVTDGKNFTHSTLLPWGTHHFQIRCFDGLFNSETLVFSSPEVNPFTIYYGDAATIFYEGFEGSTSFTQTGTGPALWHITNETSTWSNPYYSGTHAAWCGSEITGNYDNNMTRYFESPTIALVGVKYPKLGFYHWMDTVESLDMCNVQISTDDFMTQQNIYSNSGSVMPWEAITVDLSTYEGQDVRFRFYFRSDASITRRGWYVDDVRVYGSARIAPQTPANASSRVHGNIAFRWGSVGVPGCLLNYTVQVSNSSDFSAVVAEMGGIPWVEGTMEVNIFVNGTSGVYYWRVRAECNGAASPWSATNWFFLVESAFAPQLTNLQVWPGDGINSTAFNFSVSYADGDNQLPVFLTLTVNNTSYPMVADDPSDTDVTDGKGYHLVMALPWGTYQFMANCSDGFSGNATGWISGPLVNPFISFPGYAIPVSPADGIGCECGQLTFSWTSPIQEPGLPTTFRWQLSNSSSFGTILDELSGIPETSAAISINRSITTSGEYYWRVRPEVYGFVGTWTSPRQLVLSWRPVLSDVLLSPLSGDTVTTFTFEVTYSDADNVAALYVDVIINFTSYPMVQVNSSDVDYTDGARYRFTSTLPPGTYMYVFVASDGVFMVNSDIVSGLNVTNDSPVLSSALVTPETGNTGTTFNFTVTYTDPDNNAPAYVRVHIDGIEHEMDKKNAGDDDYSDGCEYTFTCLLPPVAHGYYFSASDGFASTSTAPASGPVVVNSAPTFAAEHVTPTMGTSTTTFWFNVTYIDADNNAPSYIHVNIDGTTFPMIKQNSSDLNYTDGCVYLLNTTLSLFLHAFYFAASDGFEAMNSSSYAGPVLTNSIPALSGDTVSLGTGNLYTTFTFRVIYTDPDNHAPSFVRVYVDGTPYSMSRLDVTDDNYADGCTYVYSTSLGTGTHSYYFAGCDGHRAVSTMPRAGPTVSTANTAPVLSSGSVITPTGNIYSTFIYRVTYTDAENDAPSIIRVYIDGSAYTMSKENASDTSYTDGCVYMYSHALPTGTHNFYFYTYDGYATASTMITGGPTVSTGNTAPWLSAGSISHPVGNGFTTFIYRVVYTDVENAAPSYVRVHIDGSAYAMVKETASDITYHDGCTYVYSRTLAIGTHNYYFSTSDGSLSASTSTITSPTVSSSNTAPSLSSPFVFPLNSTTTSAITYVVVYADAENDAPSYVRVYIDGSAYIMSKQFASDSIYTDGCIYVFSTTLPAGVHSCYFTAHDGLVAVTTPTYAAPTISATYPALSSGTVSPASGNMYTSFTFSVVYTDPRNLPPTYTRVVIDGLSYAMVKQNASDLDYTDGCTYYFTTTLLVMAHTHYFTANNGEVVVSTTSASGPAVTNNPPSLIAGSVTPSSGNYTSDFTYSVTYADADNNPPNYVRVYIDGSYYSMVKQNASDINFIDGCIYTYALNGLAVAPHTYYFSANDGYATNTTAIVAGPGVLDVAAPRLVNPGVSPATGLNTTTFVFTVTYYDADNILPVSITVTINSTTYAMAGSVPADTNVVDGKVYTCSRVLTWGLYRFRMNCSDGTFVNATGWLDGPVVNPFLYTQENVTVFHDDFEAGTSKWETISGLWHVTTSASTWPNPYHSAVGSMWCGSESTGQYTNSHYAELVSQPVDLRPYRKAYLELYHWLSTESGYDYCRIYVRPNSGAGWTQLYSYAGSVSPWQRLAYNISSFCTASASAFQVRFYFTSDGSVLSRGWLVDDVRITASTVTGQTGGAPSLLLPANNSNVAVGNVTFSWSTITVPTGAVNFRWQLSATAGFSEILDGIGGVPSSPGTTYLPRNVTRAAGTYYWRVRGESAPFTGNWSAAGCIFLRQPPALRNASLYPSMGNVYTTFIFQVNYVSPNNLAPVSIYAYIDGSAYGMTKVNTSDMVYTDGCSYYLTRTLTTGTHNHYFFTNDGYLTTTTSTSSGPYVTTSNIAPSLAAGTVTPTSGQVGTLFTYTVTYYDLDNNAPYYMRVYVDGSYYSMAKQNSSDNNYVDGCIFTYSRNLTPGSHTYYFYAHDGYSSSTTTSVSGPTVVNYAPVLSAPTMSPPTGNTLTTFIYSVNYTDADNNAPYYMRVYIDGSYYSMAKQNGSDNNYVDGCTYVYSRTLGPGSHTYYFYASDGYITASTATLDGPTVTNVAPVLSSGSVAPSTGTPSTTFTYTVIYTDADNNAPSYVGVYIDGSYYAMAKQNGSDNNYVDGCTYLYSRILAPLAHTYYFQASDGYIMASTATIDGPVVINSAPSLTSPSVSPTTGTTSTVFNFSVVYTDLDNQAPSYVRVYIDGTPYSMSKANGGDTNYTDGCLYTFSTILPAATHAMSFEASDSYEPRWTEVFSLPVVTDTAPTLSAASVTPSTGNTMTTYAFRVIYTDAENSAPAYIRIYFNGLEYSMAKLASSDLVYSDGCAYCFTYAASLSPGTYSYKILASDGSFHVATSTYIGPTVTSGNTAPTLNSGSISSGSGNTYTTFLYKVTYMDADNNAPYYIRVYVDGSYSTMSKENASDYNYADGCTYIHTRTLSTGSHNYYFYAYDGFSTVSTTQVSLPSVSSTNTVPTLTGASIAPSSGNTYTAFTYRVVYTDADNNAPYYIRVYVDGSYSTMSKENASDYNYADGCTYIHTRTLSTGSHNYYFYAYDGFSTVSTTQVSLPSVSSTNTAPTLSSGYVTPTIGFGPTTFFYHVTYTDADNNAPYYIRVYVDGSYYTMSKLDPYDLNYVDGCIYIVSTPLSVMLHNYYFYAYDGISTVATANAAGPRVINTSPQLIAPSLSQTSGSLTTNFTYTITYTDAENNAPTYVYVYIDGSSYLMAKQSSADAVYLDGCTYTYTCTLAPGSHIYYFYASDGFSSTSTPSYSGPTVTNSVPVLSSGSVSPGSGTWTQTFTYTVTYSDADNQAPYYVRVYIDGYYSTMTKVNGGDTTYTDGCIYSYSRTLSDGWHSFYFRAYDGYSYTSSPTYSGPAVQGNRAPTLTSLTISPASGDADTTYTFSVTYTDADNDAPDYVTISIDGAYTGYYMSKQVPSDNTYTDGVVFQYSMRLSAGSHTYEFRCSDGYTSCETDTQRLDVPLYSSEEIATAVTLVLLFSVGLPLFIGITATKVYNKKKGITKVTSTTVYRRPSPAFQPMYYTAQGGNSTPPARPFPPPATPGTTPGGGGGSMHLQSTSQPVGPATPQPGAPRALPSIRSASLQQHSLVEPVARQPAPVFVVDDQAYDQELSGFISGFVEDWKAPGEDLGAYDEDEPGAPAEQVPPATASDHVDSRAANPGEEPLVEAVSPTGSSIDEIERGLISMISSRNPVPEENVKLPSDEPGSRVMPVEGTSSDGEKVKATMSIVGDLHATGGTNTSPDNELETNVADGPVAESERDGVQGGLQGSGVDTVAPSVENGAIIDQIDAELMSLVRGVGGLGEKVPATTPVGNIGADSPPGPDMQEKPRSQGGEGPGSGGDEQDR